MPLFLAVTGSHFKFTASDPQSAVDKAEVRRAKHPYQEVLLRAEGAQSVQLKMQTRLQGGAEKKKAPRVSSAELDRLFR